LEGFREAYDIREKPYRKSAISLSEFVKNSHKYTNNIYKIFVYSRQKKLNSIYNQITKQKFLLWRDLGRLMISGKNYIGNQLIRICKKQPQIHE
jgi:hypothetical protein